MSKCLVWIDCLVRQDVGIGQAEGLNCNVGGKHESSQMLTMSFVL